MLTARKTQAKWIILVLSVSLHYIWTALFMSLLIHGFLLGDLLPEKTHNEISSIDKIPLLSKYVCTFLKLLAHRWWYISPSFILSVQWIVKSKHLFRSFWTVGFDAKLSTHLKYLCNYISKPFWNCVRYFHNGFTLYRLFAFWHIHETRFFETLVFLWRSSTGVMVLNLRSWDFFLLPATCRLYGRGILIHLLYWVSPGYETMHIAIDNWVSLEITVLGLSLHPSQV